MNQRLVNLILPALMLAVMGAVGCQTQTVNKGDGSGNPEDLIVTSKLGPLDLQSLAQKIADDVKISPRVHASTDSPAIIRVSPFLNETDDPRFPMQELVDSVMNELTRTGKLEAISADAAASEAFIIKQKMNRQSGVHLEDYTLSGRVTRDEESAGNKRQYTYYVIFKVSDTNTGTVVLSSQAKRIKLTTRGGLGF